MLAFLLVTSLLLIQTPFLIGTSFAALMAVLLPFWITIGLRTLDFSQHALSFGANESTPRDFKLPLALLAVWGLFSISFVRAALAGAVPAPEALHQTVFLTTLILFGLVVFQRPSVQHIGADYLIWAIALYLLANAALHLAGWRVSVSDDVSMGIGARMLASVGVFTDRTLFPTASGLNNFGAVAGIAIAAGIAGAATKRASGLRVGAIGAAAIGLYIILRTDSRAGLFSALGAGAAVVALPTNWLRHTRLGVLFIPTLPIALFGAAVLLASVLGTSSLVRNPEEIYNLGSRAFIWAAIGAELSSFSLQHIIGFGFFGQTQSTIVQQFGDVVGAGYDTGRLTAHNMLLQLSLDIGYLGVVGVLALFWQALSRIDRVPLSQRKIVVAVLIYLLLAGVTESTPTPYYRECFALFVLLIAFVVNCGGKETPDELTQGRGGG